MKFYIFNNKVWEEKEIALILFFQKTGFYTTGCIYKRMY